MWNCRSWKREQGEAVGGTGKEVLSSKFWVLSSWRTGVRDEAELGMMNGECGIVGIWSVWSIRSVSCVWLNETNQMNQIDQTNQINQMNKTNQIEVARLKLDRLEAATTLQDLAVLPGNRFETLKGNRKGQYSIRINAQWRICFYWPKGSPGPVNVEIVDYH